TYTGDRWSVAFPNDQHRLDGMFPIQHQAKESAFDLLLPDTRNWPDRTLEGVFFDAQTYDIRMLTNTGSILFTPGRVLSVDPGSGMDLIPYFNNLGEIFVQRSLRVKDNYRIKARVLRTDDPAFSDILTQARLSSERTQEEAYRAACLALPDNLPASVRTLTEKITVSTDDPYAKALAIRAFLRSTCVYSLVVPNVPEGRDFVEWFLQTKVGYCTYFASALTVLSRCAGIPARYVEGFAMSAANARSLDNGFSEYTVTGKEAHAWSEVYIDGAGWIPMDATPGFDSADLTPTPEPSASPSPEPVTEIPETPTPLPTPSPPVSGSTDTGSSLRLVLFLVLIAALVSAGGIYLYRRMHWYDTDRMTRRLGSRAKIVETYWRASTHMLRRTGLFSEPSNTTYDYVTRWTTGIDGLHEPAIVDSLRWLANLHVAVVYGNHEPSGEEISRAQHVYRLLARRYRLYRGRLRYYFYDLPFGRLL
ncbi:MAG TPA: transglutaminase domain-containing protein, partial [Clostridia bacterium]